MTTNENFKNTRIEFHILQSFPVTCLNRDDVGSPKTATIGGSLRARVSSQCWKRQVRLAMHDLGVKLGIRTKKVSEYIQSECEKIAGESNDSIKKCSDLIASQLGKDTLVFFTEKEAHAFAEFAKEKGFDPSQIKDKEVAKIAKKVMDLNLDGLDIALFGRMVAQAADLNVEAACSFAHAISTHKISNEVDFFTAIDDLSTESESGAGHMGSLEFNSATYYRYISLDLGQLNTSLNGEGLANAVEAFTKALFIAVPSARQTTQSGASSWDYAKILVRKGQRLQIGFEDAVKSKGEGFLKPSIEKLKQTLEEKEKMMGSLFGNKSSYEWGIDSNFSIDHLVEQLKQDIEV